jgi:hypothetical protein
VPSDRPKLTEDAVTIQRLKEIHASLVSDFRCAGKDEGEFLKNDALKHQNLGLSETFLLVENGGNRLISYVTLSFGSFKMSENEPLGGIPIREKQTHIFSTHLPCLLIGKLATDEREEGRGGGTFLLDFSKKICAQINGILSLPFIALHSHPDKVPYYARRSFSIAFNPQKKDADTVTMYHGLTRNLAETGE